MNEFEIKTLRDCTIKAIKHLDKNPWDSKNNSRTGDLVYKGKLYPTKPVLWEIEKQIENENLDVKIPSLSGGEAIFQFFEKLGFEIQRKEFIKTNSLEKLVESYIKTLRLKGDPNESYKWDAVEHFQKHWNIDAIDFYKMFSESFRKVSNLLYQNSWGFISKIAQNFPEDTRQMFRILYDENIDLANRFEAFKIKSEELLPKLIEVLAKDKLNTQQDERTLSVYLSFRFPEKYFIYKISFYRNLCDVLKESKAPSGKKYFHYLKLAQMVKENYISNNNELLELHKGIYPQFKWDDKNLITQNFLYTTLENEDVYSNLMMTRNNIENFNVFFGKVTNLRNQLDEKFYQTEDESWFGELTEGAFVFIIGEGKIRLWRAKEWIQEDKLFRMNFEEIIEDTKLDTKALQAFKYFKLSIDLIVKTVRSTAKSKKAFFKINVHNDFSEKMIIDKSVYQNPENYRNIILKPSISDLVDDEFNFQIYKNSTQYNIKIPKFSESLGDFIDNTPNIGKGRINKDKTLDKIIKNNSCVWNYKEISMINLYDAFFCNYNSKEIEEVELIEPNKKDMYPLNQILYGAPGTGKTYTTKKLAIEIIDGKEYLDSTEEDRDIILTRYNELALANQIHFTTFHQSMSYEDFIEGIKPDTIDNRVTYEVKDGIFKQISDFAISKNESNFDESYNNLLKEILANDNDFLELKTATQKSFYIKVNSKNSLNLYTSENKNKQGSITKEKLNKQVNGHQEFDGWEGYVNGVIEYLKNKHNLKISGNSTDKKYVLIIDEINRGNVSSIFGELITLLEEDKRKGNKEEIEVVLPYSQDKFSVPDNLYIIGTMNTADRSVESLDTALRRRFSFVEMPAKPEKLVDVTIEDAEEIDLEQLLDKINQRIELLIDKDHQIGHSFFINLKDLNGLKTAFKNKIIPLLEEYFFGDFGKIGLVLGENFISVKNENNNSGILAKFSAYEEVDFITEKKVYQIKNCNELKAQDFISIYE